MASRYYGANKGSTLQDVSEDSSTTSKKVEVVVDLDASYSRSEVLLALEVITQKILNGNWPPA